MQFRARLRRSSAVYRNWRGGGRVRGEICGVAFDRMANGDFVTRLLEPVEISALQASPDAEFEVTTQPLPAIVDTQPVAAPEPEPTPKARPARPVRGRWNP